MHSNVEGIRVLLDHPRDLGDFEIAVCTDSFGRLPLHWAAWGPRYHDQTKHNNAKDKVGDTALHYAVRKYGYNNDKHFVILQTLCKHGADSSIRGRQGKTPLHSLASCVHRRDIISISLIDLLLEHGASVYDIDDDGNTPLHVVATDILHSKSAQQLISKGADVSATNNQGNTSLHHAAKGIFSPWKPSDIYAPGVRVKEQDKIIEVLLHGISKEKAEFLMNQPNSNGKTPHQICKETRKKWEESDEVARKEQAKRERWHLEMERSGGRGRGRGRGRGSII
ncbi:hypothetical protein ACMFMG_012145 [Clarireedia jacksonii]